METNFDSNYSIKNAQIAALGGTPSMQFDSVYSQNIEILRLLNGISGSVIDDSSVSLNTTWSSSKIASEIVDAGFDVQIVTELPNVGDPHIIYFILKSDPSTGDTYDEWMYINNNWEKVGNTQIDLSAYATISSVNSSLALKQDLLTAGQNISIDASNNISAEGYVFDSSNYSFATKYLNEEDEQNPYIATNTATGLSAVAEGIQTTATGEAAHAEGAWGTVASGNYSHAEGGATQAINSGSHAEGQQTVASGKYSHAEGNYSVASGKSAHAEGGKVSGKNATTATGSGSHAEGQSTLASGQSAHAEGEETVASGPGSHAEGVQSVASGTCAHAEGRAVDGQYTHAEGEASHAEGWSSHSEGSGSHSEGRVSHAKGEASHAEGKYTFAQNVAEHAEGMYNLSHTDNASNGQTIHSTGIGNSANNRINALEIMQNGDQYIIGLGGYQGIDTKVQNASIKTVQEVINGKADVYEIATLADIEALFVMPTFYIDSSLYKTYGNLNWTQWLSSKYNTANYTHIYNASSYDSTIEQIPEVDSSAYPVQNGQYYSTCEDTYVPPTPSGPADNEIWYTTESGEVWEPYDMYGTGDTLVIDDNTLLSNTYQYGHGVLRYANDITMLDQPWGKTDYDHTTDLISITLPHSINYIGDILTGNYDLNTVYYNGTVAECGEIDMGNFATYADFDINHQIICLDGTYDLWG